MLMMEESGWEMEEDDILRARDGMVSGPVDLFGFSFDRVSSHQSGVTGERVRGVLTAYLVEGGGRSQLQVLMDTK